MISHKNTKLFYVIIFKNVLTQKINNNKLKFHFMIFSYNHDFAYKLSPNNTNYSYYYTNFFEALIHLF